MNRLKRAMTLGLLGGQTLAQKIQSWQNSQTTLVRNAGIPTSSFLGTTGVSGQAVGGRTVISGTAKFNIRQDGFIRKANIHMYSADVGRTLKFKIFRYNGSTYDMISESEVLPCETIGLHEFILSTPMACQCGDIPGIWLCQQEDAGLDLTVSCLGSGGNLRYVAGDITTSNAFTSSLGVPMCIDFFSYSPYFVVTGDSIAEGHNGTVKWHSFYDNGPAGEPTSEIWNQLRGLIGSGDILQYQNHAKGSQTFSWVASDGIVSSALVGAKVVCIYCGVNDVAGARTWEQVATDLGTIRAAIPTTSTLLISEIIPWTNGSDAAAATIRTFNTNLAAWCASNSARLVVCHNEMGQIRVATGELDDLLTAYDQDGVHITTAGVAKMAEIWKRYL